MWFYFRKTFFSETVKKLYEAYYNIFCFSVNCMSELNQCIRVYKTSMISPFLG